MLEFNLNFFIIFSMICLFFTYLIAKYSKLFFSGSLLDHDFLKPQAFHDKPVARIGGLIILFLFLFFLLFYYFVLDIFLKDYLTISVLLFFLGFLDDLKVQRFDKRNSSISKRSNQASVYV